MATAGRALIKEQQKAALANIQKNKAAALKQLDIQYASADKAKQSFGFIGITFLAVLFGSIFLNDFIKFLVYIYNELLDSWCEEREHEVRNNERKKQNEHVTIQIDQEKEDEKLADNLDNVYFKLVKAKAMRNN